MPEELGGGRGGCLPGEREDDHEVEAERGEQVGAFLVHRQPRRLRLGPQHGNRVRLEGEQPGRAAGGMRGSRQLRHEHLVAAMHAVEVADRQEDRAVGRWDGETVVDVHASAANTLSGHHSPGGSKRRIAMTLPSSPSA